MSSRKRSNIQTLKQAFPYTVEEIDKARAEKDLQSFITQAWNVVEPSTRYMSNWHIDLVAEYLQAVSNGDILRLIINIPPRYMKSTLVSVMWPPWTWTMKPHTRWIFASYAADLAAKHSMLRRDIIQSEWYQKNWGDKVRIKSDQNQKTEYQNTAYGNMTATSVGGTLTGKGGDFIVIDDPLDPRRAWSDAERKTANKWMDNTVSTRLNDKRTGAIVVIMQRLHDMDVTGHLLSKKDGDGIANWTHLKLPNPAPHKTIITFPISKRRKVVEIDEPLWEAKENKKQLDFQRIEMTPWEFACQYQQEPAPLEGGIIKEEGFRFYTYQSLPMVHMQQIIQSWDMNFKETKEGSYVVGQVWGRFNADKYLLDQYRKRIGFNETISAVLRMNEKWPQTQSILIEDKANGPAIIETLKSKVAGILPILPKGSKEERASAISPQIQSGNVYLPDISIAPWIADYLHELCTFPNAASDDQVDATTQALQFLPRGNMFSTADLREGTIVVGQRFTSGGLDW